MEQVEFLTNQLRAQEEREERLNEEALDEDMDMDDEFARAIPELQASLARSNYDKARARCVLPQSLHACIIFHAVCIA